MHHFSKSRQLCVLLFVLWFSKKNLILIENCENCEKGEMILLRVFRVKSFNFHSFVLLSCSFSHVTHLKVIKPSQAIQNWFQDYKFKFKSFWSNESLIREICHAKKSSCEWNVTNLVFLRVCKPVSTMRVFEGLCLHLVAGYQVSLPKLYNNLPIWWQLFKVCQQYFCRQNLSATLM